MNGKASMSRNKERAATTLMKKKTIQLLISVLIVSCSSTKTVENRKAYVNNEKPILYDFIGKIDSEQLLFIKDSYNWNTEKILIINYSQPISSCHFNNNQITTESEKWWKDFYSVINTEDCLNIKVLANGERIKRKLDNIHYFDDKNEFLLDSFFARKKSCFGVLVINEQGDYIQYNGHYSERQVAKFIENLRG